MLRVELYCNEYCIRDTENQEYLWHDGMYYYFPWRFEQYSLRGSQGIWWTKEEAERFLQNWEKKMNREEIEEQLRSAKREILEREDFIKELEKKLSSPKHGDVIEWVGIGPTYPGSEGRRRLVACEDGELTARDVNGKFVSSHNLGTDYRQGSYKVIYNVFDVKS